MDTLQVYGVLLSLSANKTFDIHSLSLQFVQLLYDLLRVQVMHHCTE